MARRLATLEQEIRTLNISDKETLLRVLWEELDGTPDPGVDAAWLDEAQRRCAQIDSGEVETIPTDQVFARLRSKLGI